jgi:hypothetical protein
MPMWTLWPRRRFAKALGMLGTLPLWTGPGRAAPTPTSRPAAGASPASAPGARPAARGGQEPDDPEARALLEMLRAQYGDRLTEDEWRDVGEQIRQRLAGGALRNVRLANGDEPAFVFRVAGTPD